MMHEPHPALVPQRVSAKEWGLAAGWLVLLVGLSVFFEPAAAVVGLLDPSEKSVLRLVYPLAAWLFVAVALGRSLTRIGRKVRERWRFRTGRYTEAERAEFDRVARLNGSEEQARALARSLVTGEPYRIGPVWHATLEADEVAYLDAPSGSSRFYTADDVGIAGFYSYQWTRVVVTDRRLMVRDQESWLSFYYDQVQAVFPNAASGSVVFEVAGTAPLRIEGPAAAVATVAAVWAVFGTVGLNEHPGLDYLHPVGSKFLQ